MNIVYDETTGIIRGVGPFSQGMTLVGTLPSDFVKYFALGKYLARPLSSTTAEVYLDTSWTNPSVPSTVIGANVGKTVYVDQVYGNDATALRETAAYPFLTLSSALDAAQPGDTIVVQPGVYEGCNLIKDGVSWLFSTVTINSNSPVVDNGPNGVASDVTCNIRGDASIVCIGSSNPVINMPRSGSNILVDILGITTNSQAVSIAHGEFNSRSIVSSASTACISLLGDARVYCNAVTSGIVADISGNAVLDCKTMTSTSDQYAISIGVGGTPTIRGNIIVGSGSAFNIANGAQFVADIVINKQVGSLAEAALASGQITVTV
jgi:hypothetical protein